MIDRQKLLNLCTITVTPEEEFDGPEGHFASGDDEADAKLVQKIREDAEWNNWAWCCVKVAVSYKGLEGTAYLGACSYEGKRDFVENSGYYRQLVDDAVEELAKQLENLLEGLDNLTTLD